MLQDTFTDNMVNGLLKQRGATSIKTKPAYINIAKFELSDSVTVVYLYELKENEAIYLQRLEPYPMTMGQIDDENQLVAVIEEDIKKFKDALTSKNFNKFIEIAGTFAEVNKGMEKCLLSPKTVETADLKVIEADLESIGADIKKMAENAK